MKSSNLNTLLSTLSVKNFKDVTPTHTRIGDKNLGVFGGSYFIEENNEESFYNEYINNVVCGNGKEYLTEKQLDIGPIAVDFDFRYNFSIDKRQHTDEHILDMSLLYLDELKKIVNFNSDFEFPIFIFEKPNVNKVTEKNITKDGIHMIIGINLNREAQLFLRKQIISKIGEIWDLPLINDYDSVLDEGISKGSTNWQLYGSQKPGNEKYELTQYYNIKFDSDDEEFSTDVLDVSDFDIKKDFCKLSVRYKKHPTFPYTESFLKTLEKGNSIGKKRAKVNYSNKNKLRLIVEDDEDDKIRLDQIKNQESLDIAIENFLNSLGINEYEIRETHLYCQLLPEEFYNPGSHYKNRLVAFALKKTDERLFLSWVKLRSNAEDFDFDSIPDLYQQWKKYFNKNKDGITKKSILYWAQQYNPEGYKKVKDESIDAAIETTLSSPTEYDKAYVLKQMYKDKYICTSYDKKGCWWKYENHKWVADKGLSLREAISKNMYDLYSKKLDSLQINFNDSDNNDEHSEFVRRKGKILGELMMTLKRTNDKNNIMREAMELFYDGDFIKNMDTNQYLLGFKNGVVDFKEKIFRPGYPEDYITKSTKIDFISFENLADEIENVEERIKEVKDFMKTLFPIPEVENYMWEHLSSVLIGTNINQTFNIYHGSGSNGKSMLTDLMGHTLGDYKGTVPITLVTEKRGSIGGTSDEIIKLKGVRYAVMQEPSKNVKINEGIMKELSGGDPVQARALYSESEVFIPQFDLVVCTNNVFDFDSNDDGTWRRVVKVDFVSKFRDEGESFYDDTEFVFPKDKNLKEKLPKMAIILASLLVKIAFEKEGKVNICDFIKNSTRKYRKSQDTISCFVDECIEVTDNIKDKICKKDITSIFNEWFKREQGANRKPPKGVELAEYMNKRFGLCKNSYWSKCRFIEINEEEDEEHI